MLHSKKVGTLAIEGSDKEKQTNEIKIAAPMLDGIEIKGKTITADALLTQRDFANYLINRQADYHFTAKGNQATLLADIQLHFDSIDQEPDFIHHDNGDHGRIETRKIWMSTGLNGYLDFPHVGQVFMIERDVINKKTGRSSQETIFGITSKSPEKACAKQVLEDNRKHWVIESCHYIIDWNYDEDRSTIRKGFGPENITRLRRFAVGLLKSKQNTKTGETIAEMIKKLSFNTRLVFDYLKMTANSNQRSMTYRSA